MIGGTTLETGATLDLTSESSSIIRTLAIGVSGSGGFAAQVTAMGNVIANNTSAVISGSEITAEGDININANDIAPTMIPLMDAVGSYITDAKTAQALKDGLSGTPFDPTANIISLMVSVAGTGGVAVNGAFTGNIISNNIEALIHDSKSSQTRAL
jgi:hypothetical protein